MSQLGNGARPNAHNPKIFRNFSQLSAIVKNSNGSELEDVVELLSSFFGPRREKNRRMALEEYRLDMSLN